MFRDIHDITIRVAGKPPVSAKAILLHMDIRGKRRWVGQDLALGIVTVAIPAGLPYRFVRSDHTDELAATRIFTEVEGERFDEVHELALEAIDAGDAHSAHLATMLAMCCLDAERKHFDMLLDTIDGEN